MKVGFLWHVEGVRITFRGGVILSTLAVDGFYLYERSGLTGVVFVFTLLSNGFSAHCLTESSNPCSSSSPAER